MARTRRPAAGPDRRPDPALVDALYGLEPVYEPGRPGASLGEFVTVDCPYCGERYQTPVDLTAGSSSSIEDCQVCCRPIELAVEVDEDGALAGFAARRLD